MQLKLYFHPETKLLIHTSARSEKNLKYLEEVGAFHVGDVKGRDVGFPKNQWNDAGFFEEIPSSPSLTEFKKILEGDKND